MRAIVAVDGSPGAEAATELVADLRWPAGMEVDVCAVTDAGALVPMPLAAFPGDIQPLADAIHELERDAAERAAARLRSCGLDATVTMLRGRPTDALVDQADATSADLLVCGSRGRGTIVTMLLGSVSAELAGRVSCPVLVARHPQVTSVLLAHDGSDPARAAADIIAGWPAFRGLPVMLLSVVPEVADWIVDPAILALPEVTESVEASARAARRQMAEVQAGAAERLNAAGHAVTEVVRAGSTADVILDEAARSGADLIALGTHARRGLERILLGSVARNVLLHTHASVLVAPKPRIPRMGQAR